MPKKLSKKATEEVVAPQTKVILDEATTSIPPVPTEPQEVITWAPDKDWTLEQWKELIEELIDSGLITWKEVTALVLGQMNPPQVGTSLASNKRVQAFHEPRKVWQAVRKWFYDQRGVCENCGTRIDLQADHINPRENQGDDRLENFQLLCRRCNVVKRPSHKKGGVTYLSAESALMWILFVLKPNTYEEYKALCRKYGLSMADIRFQEAWAMARWLEKENKYKIGKSSTY